MKNVPPRFRFAAFAKGFSLPLRGTAFLLSHRGLKRYAVLPLFLNILLYGLALVVFFHFLWNWQIGEIAWDFWGPVGHWLAAAVNWLKWTVKLVMAVAAVALSFFTFTGVGLVLASPLNDILSEKVEAVYAGGEEKLDLPFRFTARAAMLSAWDSIGTLVKQLFCTVAALPFLLVPLIGFLPLMLVGAYFAGFGFLDSAMARNFLRPRHKRLVVDERFWEILGFGLAMQLAFAIPLLGILLLPIGVTAGTLLYCSSDWDDLLARGHLDRPEGFVPPARAAGAEKAGRG